MPKNISHVQSIFNMIPEEDQKGLPEDEDTPEKRSEKIWDFFGKKDNGMEVCYHLSIHASKIKEKSSYALFKYFRLGEFQLKFFLQLKQRQSLTPQIKSQKENSSRE